MKKFSASTCSLFATVKLSGVAANSSDSMLNDRRGSADIWGEHIITQIHVVMDPDKAFLA
jgi:hypothetical protein